MYFVCHKYAHVSVAAKALAHDHISDVQASACAVNAFVVLGIDSTFVCICFVLM